MQKQQVFKVKGMQRDASMANANGEFAYEILNMRLMPAEDLSGFSLTNEKGTTQVITDIEGQVIGQCPTNDSLVVFTTNATYNENDERTGGFDYIYEIYKTPEGSWTAGSLPLYKGDLNFHADKHIEALFNYETEDIQKVYWIDGINQLRCINLVGEIQTGNNQQFDSVKEINSLPSVEIERVAGGSFTAGVIQYYVTYFNKNASESSIVYTSPLLYIAYDNRGANVNDQVSTAFKLTFTDLDTDNWEYMRIYITHRTSIDATPEASIITELNINNSTIEFTDNGNNRTSIAPTDLYFTGGKFVKAGTMTVKDQVMFLGNLNIQYPNTIDIVGIQELFDSIRNQKNHPLSTSTTKAKENKLEEYEDTYYYYKNQLSNTDSITHYKYGEKYRFGISVLDKYGNWSSPIWIKDAFIEVPPTQIDDDTLNLPCPSLNLSYQLTYNNETKTLLEHIQDKGAFKIKPIIVFPSEDERKVITQGVVCPTVYNLKDRKENGPYAQASWFMRPNVPGDLWGIESFYFGKKDSLIAISSDSSTFVLPNLSHKSDIQTSGHALAAYYGIASNGEINQYLYDDFTIQDNWEYSSNNPNSQYTPFLKLSFASPYIKKTSRNQELQTRQSIVENGNWLEFRHNYSLRTKGSSFGAISTKQTFADTEFQEKGDGFIFNKGMVRGAEIDSSRFSLTAPVNRFISTNVDGEEIIKAGNGEKSLLLEDISQNNSAYYIDNSIVTLNTPEMELSNGLHQSDLSDCNFRIIGIIPLTATVSDMSVEVTNPESDPDSTAETGLHKIFIGNKNIGNHGFKGLVSTNAYYSYFGNTPEGKPLYYSMMPLYPWNSTGSLGMYSNISSESGDTSTLKKKVLSNLRYSAISSYFPINGLSFSDNIDSVEDRAYVSSLNRDSIIGWKPGTGCKVEQVTNSNNNSIVKLFNLGYSNTSLVYRGTVDSIALLGTGDLGSSPAYSGLYGYGRRLDLNSDSISNNIRNMKYAPAIWVDTKDSYTYSKLSKGASIKYKSSPHLIVGFNCYNTLWDSQKVVQETLPAWKSLNEEGLLSTVDNSNLEFGFLYEDSNVSSLYHQDYISLTTIVGNTEKVPLYSDKEIINPEKSENAFLFIREDTDCSIEGNIEDGLYTFNQTSLSPWSSIFKIKEIGILDYSTMQISGDEFNLTIIKDSTSQSRTAKYTNFYLTINDRQTGILTAVKNLIKSNEENIIEYNTTTNFDVQLIGSIDAYFSSDPSSGSGSIGNHVVISPGLVSKVIVNTTKINDSLLNKMKISFKTIGHFTIEVDDDASSAIPVEGTITLNFIGGISGQKDTIKTPNYGWLWLGEIYRETDPTFGGDSDYALQNNQWERGGDDSSIDTTSLQWTIGDTYYQRFDTLKTHAYSEEDQNSIVDITSFMVETRINIDGRYDRNRGQENNLQMSPTNFNLMNDVYSQRDNFFTYRILDDDLQARTNFPNQITWSLTKTAGATVDAWMNITLASVLDLDGTKGELIALKNFNNNIIAFQEKGLSHIMFNSRAQIATSEAVPIQIANTGKVDGQQYFTTDVGCQDKWNIVTTPNGLYFVDYFNKSIYMFNGKLEDISTPNGFRSWCYENLNSTANIIGYYDVKNKEVMYYIGDTRFTLDNNICPRWLGFSELTGAFSSFYTYPKAWFANVQDQGLWLLLDNNYTKVYTHQTGNYNQLLNTAANYGLTVIPRQDSNTVKTFNNVEFRADSFDVSGYNESILPFDAISAETEYQIRTVVPLTYNPYRPSNLKKKLRTWRANIPRVNNGYNRFVNQWAKIGLWKTNPSTEKTILHDLSVWYSE